MFPGGVRHTYPAVDVNRLANMFDFTLLSQFAPYGESKEDGEYVYDCLLFKRTSKMRDAIVNRPEWLEECTETVGAAFGSKAFEFAGIPAASTSRYFSYYGEWVFNSDLDDDVAHAIKVVKTSDPTVFGTTSVDMIELKKVSEMRSPIAEFAQKILGFTARCS